MGYIESNLNKGERILYKTGLHWWIFIRSLLTNSVLIILFAASEAIIFAILLAAVLLGLTALNYFTSELGITDRRLILKTGVLRRKSTEFRLARIESFRIDEPLLGRIIGFETLRVKGIGGTGDEISPIIGGRKFRAIYNEAIDDIEQTA